ncbi:MAG: hypothetical protein RI906_1833 [Pseudomonadota bacterium]|jgi:hypothetical protein
MRVHNDKQETHSAHAKRNESLLSENVRIFASKRIVVSEDRSRLGEVDAVRAQVGRSLGGVPYNTHVRIVWTIVFLPK